MSMILLPPENFKLYSVRIIGGRNTKLWATNPLNAARQYSEFSCQEVPESGRKIVVELENLCIHYIFLGFNKDTGNSILRRVK